MEIDVDMCDMLKASSPDSLVANLGPCTAIGVYDGKTGSGYMLHEIQFELETLESRLKEIKENYGSLKDLKVYLTGNSFGHGDKEQRKYEKQDRPRFEETLRKYFSESQLTINWLPDYCSASLFLHLDVGEFELEIDKDE